MIYSHHFGGTYVTFQSKAEEDILYFIYIIIIMYVYVYL